MEEEGTEIAMAVLFLLIQTDKSMEVTQREMKQHEAEERISALLKLNQVSSLPVTYQQLLPAILSPLFLGDTLFIFLFVS